MSTPYPDQGTYTITPQSMDNIATSLTPFSSSALGQPYNSASSRYVGYFGYAYPEIEDWHQTTQQLKINCTQQIYNLYDPNSIFGKRHDHRHKPVPVPALQKRKQLSPGATTKDWSIALSVNKFDLDGVGFWLRFFVGDIPQNPQDWASTCAGSVQIMPPRLTGNGPYPELIEYDELSLDDEVAAAGYDPEDIHGIGRYLGKNLQWRVQKVSRCNTERGYRC
jgi:tyrosinase